MADEREVHAHRGAPAERSNGRWCIPDDDQAPHVTQCDDETLWTLDCYDERRAKLLMGMGCKPLPATHSAGKLFKVTAQQLIEFIAADAGLNVEFPKRKRAQLSPEQLEAKRERMRALNAARSGALSSMNGA